MIWKGYQSLASFVILFSIYGSFPSSQVMTESGGELCSDMVLDRETFLDNLLPDPVIKISDAAPYVAFQETFRQSKEDEVRFLKCIGEPIGGDITIGVHLAFTRDESVTTTFAVYGSPEKVCLDGTKLCKGAFTKEDDSDEAKLCPYCIETHFIYDCSNFVGPSSDNCKRGEIGPNNTAEIGFPSRASSIGRLTMLGTGLFMIFLLMWP